MSLKIAKRDLETRAAPGSVIDLYKSLAYTVTVFVETIIFSKLLAGYLDDDEYRGLQSHLIERPDAGAVIQRSGGVRKVRWAARGKGKSGGVRVIYYWLRADEQIFLLTLYGKGEKEDLSAAELKRIAKLVEELK